MDGDHQQLIEALRARAQDPRRRTDLGGADLAPVASPADIAAAERALKTKFHPFHRRLLEEVGNGGFGPGDGLIGLPGGRTDDEGRSLIDLARFLSDSDTPGLPPGVVPLWDWGDAMWALLDEETGSMLTLDHKGITDTGRSLAAWLSDWIAGEPLWKKLYAFEERKGIDPISRKPTVVQVPGRALGTPYVPRRPS